MIAERGGEAIPLSDCESDGPVRHLPAAGRRPADMHSCLISACNLDLLIRRSGDRLNQEKSTTFGGMSDGAFGFRSFVQRVWQKTAQNPRTVG